MVRDQIEEKLKAAFKIEHLNILDESHRHDVPLRLESHFKVIIVSDCFIGICLLTRHRLIYCVLSEELASGVHALVLHSFTLNEWKRKQDKVLDSPRCYGGGSFYHNVLHKW